MSKLKLNFKKNRCLCGNKIKSGKNHKYCYACKCTERFIEQGGNAPNTKTERAIKHLLKRPGVLNTLF